MLSEAQQDLICEVYQDCENEAERLETVKEMADYHKVGEMEIRQVLQIRKLYKKTEGKSEKEQYANALYAITLIPPKEWMRLTLKSKKKLMKLFKEGNCVKS